MLLFLHILPSSQPFSVFRIMRLVESGFITRWTKEFLSASESAVTKSELAAKPFTLEDMAGLFIILSAGVGAGVLLLVVESFTAR